VAEQRLGRALFNDEWIEGLSAQETWLLEEGNRRSRLGNEPATILPGGLAIDASVSPAFALDQQQYGAARHRQTFMLWQREQVADWLVERRLLTEDGAAVDSVGFEAALRDLSSAPAPPTAPARASYAPAALVTSFNVWVAERQALGEGITEGAALSAMQHRVSPGVTRAAARRLIESLPENLRSGRGRPPTNKIAKN